MLWCYGSLNFKLADTVIRNQKTESVSVKITNSSNANEGDQCKPTHWKQAKDSETTKQSVGSMCLPVVASQCFNVPMTCTSFLVKVTGSAPTHVPSENCEFSRLSWKDYKAGGMGTRQHQQTQEQTSTSTAVNASRKQNKSEVLMWNMHLFCFAHTLDEVWWRWTSSLFWEQRSTTDVGKIGAFLRRVDFAT